VGSGLFEGGSISEELESESSRIGMSSSESSIVMTKSSSTTGCLGLFAVTLASLLSFLGFVVDVRFEADVVVGAGSIFLFGGFEFFFDIGIVVFVVECRVAGCGCGIQVVEFFFLIEVDYLV
jgi:hypothetical protein